MSLIPHSPTPKNNNNHTVIQSLIPYISGPPPPPWKKTKTKQNKQKQRKNKQMNKKIKTKTKKTNKQSFRPVKAVTLCLSKYFLTIHWLGSIYITTKSQWPMQLMTRNLHKYRIWSHRKFKMEACLVNINWYVTIEDLWCHKENMLQSQNDPLNYNDKSD